MPNFASQNEDTSYVPVATVRLDSGSHIDIARQIKTCFSSEFGHVPFCEGAFWTYDGECWEALPEHELRQRVHRFDGLRFGEGRRVRLSQNSVNSIINELGSMLAEPDFFAGCPIGINCRSGFIQFDLAGRSTLVEHAREHRQRHVLPGEWRSSGENSLPLGSLLWRLLEGSFRGDADASEKIGLLSEIAGVSALGYATRHTKPKAVVLLGRSAENGKSQVLDLMRGLLPPSAVESLPPVKFSDDHHVVKLIGRLLNTSDELGTAQAISSDAFKSIITGDPITGRDVYRPSISFRCAAQHIFACNQLPSFRGGMDRGVVRRLMVIVFNRTIPQAERVDHIGQRIANEEMNLLLDWAVRGASQFIARGHFAEPQGSRATLAEWTQTADAVLGWLDDRVEVVTSAEPPRLASATAYKDFKFWAEINGIHASRLPALNTFVQRVRAAVSVDGVEHGHSGSFRGFVGMRLRGGSPERS